MWRTLRAKGWARVTSLYVSMLRHVNSEQPQGILVKGQVAVLVSVANGALATVLAGVAFLMGDMTSGFDGAIAVLFPIGFGVVTGVVTWVALQLMRDLRL